MHLKRATRHVTCYKHSGFGEGIAVDTHTWKEESRPPELSTLCEGNRPQEGIACECSGGLDSIAPHE
jgi:hypothetical protein